MEMMMGASPSTHTFDVQNEETLGKIRVCVEPSAS